MRATLLVLVMAAAALGVWADAVFQYAVPVEAGQNRDGSPRVVTAFVWVPPTADRVRGIVIGGQLSAEAELVRDPAVRAACTQEKLAIIYMQPHIDAMFDYKSGKGPEQFTRVLDTVAAATGYKEIAVAPFFSIGHSTSCNYATCVAAWQPTRCFGVLVFKGGLSLPKFDPAADLSGIPILAVKGQFEEFGPGPSGVLRDYEDRETSWKSSRASYLKLREANERMLISLIVESGTTHMAWSAIDGEYVGLFIKKAAQARIPDWPVDATAPVTCKEIDVTSGALTSTAITNPGAAKPALYKDYKADFAGKKSAYWHVDLELANAFAAFHANNFNKRPQFVAFADPAGKPIYSQHDLRYSITPVFVGPDTFKVAGVFLNEARDKYAVPEGPIGHADGPILFRKFGGAVEQVDPDTFRVAYDRFGGGAALTAYHPGNAEYRFAEQPAGVKINKNTRGKAQTITFPAVGPLKVGGEPVKLAATSDSGLPVQYFVKSGPAVIEDSMLKIAEVPARATFPLKIEVVAYQWGSAVEPFVQTAEPVAQQITLTR